jgi:ACT domain-containing protein
MMLKHQQGTLSKVLVDISELNASILTINQNIPIHNIATVVISLDISHLNGTMDDLIDKLQLSDAVENVQLVAIE